MKIAKVIALIMLTNSMGIGLVGCKNKELEQKCDKISDLRTIKLKEFDTVSRGKLPSDPAYSVAVEPINNELKKLEKQYETECMNR
jgi:hypothetical protein